MKNFPTAFWKRFQDFKEAPAIYTVDDDGSRKTLSFWEWTRRIQRLAMGLLDKGIKPETRLGLVAPNGRDWLDLAVAAWLVGSCLVPLVPGRDRKETLRCLGRTGCGWIAVADDRARANLRGDGDALPDHIKWIVFDGDANAKGVFSLENLEEKGRELIRRGHTRKLAERIYELKPEAPTLIFFDPEPGEDAQGAFFSGAKVARQLEAIAAQAGWPDDQDVTVASLLSFGWFSSFQFTLAALYAGHSVALAPTLRSMSDDLEVLQPTYLVCGPAYLEKLSGQWQKRLEDAPELLKQMAGAGAEDDAPSMMVSALGTIGERAARKFLYDPIRREFGGNLRAIQVIDGHGSGDVNDVLDKVDVALLGHFGLAEAGITHIEHLRARRPGSAGRPIEGMATKIDGAKSGEVGELCLRGETLFDDYWAGEGALSFDDDRWLHTGRKGRLESGFLFL